MTIHQIALKPALAPADARIIERFAAVADELPGAESASVGAWRRANLDAFSLQGLPNRRVEAWKYTDLRAQMPPLHALAGLSPSRPRIKLEETIGASLAQLDCYRAVFVGGRFREDLSTVGTAPGVAFKSLRAAFDDEASAAAALAGLAPRHGDVIAQLAAAFATDGAFIRVAPKAKLDKPLHLIFIGGATPALAVFQDIVWIGEDAEVTLIETHSGGAGAQAIVASRIGLAAGAKVQHVRSSASGSPLHLASTTAELGARSVYLPLDLTVGGGLSRTESHIRFVGEAARCHYAGAMLLRYSAHADFTLVVEHAAPACESRELVKAVLDERGHGVFQGKVIVERGAQKTDGKQMANALLLSDDAEFDSKPELEIYADDVACGHGATAGQLDEELMFYLKARGIAEREARALLIAGFIGEALDRIGDEGLRGALQEKVDAWLSV